MSTLAPLLCCSCKTKKCYSLPTPAAHARNPNKVLTTQAAVPQTTSQKRAPICHGTAGGLGLPGPRARLDLAM